MINDSASEILFLFTRGTSHGLKAEEPNEAKEGKWESSARPSKNFF